MSENSDLSIRIWELRQARGMTQRELAKAAGCSRVFIAQLESAQRKDISLSRAIALARALGVSLDELVAPSSRSESPRALLELPKPWGQPVWPARPLLLALAQQLCARGQPFWPAQSVELQLDDWQTTCPVHGAPALLQYHPKTGLIVRTTCGCSRAKFLRALGLSISDLQATNRLTLRDLASHVGLSELYLRGLGVRERNGRIEIPYRNEQGQEVAVRYRLALLKTERPDRQRFGWKRGSKPCAYGLDRLSEARRRGFIIVVEGESDAWTCWRMGFPAVGLPGAACASMLTAEVLRELRCVYVVQEADPAGAIFAREVQERVQSLIPDIAVRLLIMPSHAKDLNAMYRHDANYFRSWLRQVTGTTPFEVADAGRNQAGL